MTDATSRPPTDELIAANAAYAATFADGDRPAPPSCRLAVVTCMDARMDPLAILGLRVGEAHVIRNAGGVVTDDVIRSLCLSQRALGTRSIIVMHHTGCGVQGIDEAAFRAGLEGDVGVRPPWSVETFDDPDDDVRQSIRRLRLNPFVPYADDITGLVYDVTTGRITEVDAPD